MPTSASARRPRSPACSSRPGSTARASSTRPEPAGRSRSGSSPARRPFDVPGRRRAAVPPAAVEPPLPARAHDARASVACTRCTGRTCSRTRRATSAARRCTTGSLRPAPCFGEIGRLRARQLVRAGRARRAEYVYSYGRQNWFEHVGGRASRGARRRSRCSTCRRSPRSRWPAPTRCGSCSSVCDAEPRRRASAASSTR